MIRHLTTLIVSFLLLSIAVYSQSSKLSNIKKDVAPRVVVGFDDKPTFYQDFKNRQLKLNRLQKTSAALPTDLILENYDWPSNSYQPPITGAFDFTGDGKYDPFALVTGNTLLTSTGTAQRYAVFGYIDDLGISTYLPYGFSGGFARRCGWNGHVISDKANGIAYLATYDFLAPDALIRDYIWKVDMLTDPTVATQITTLAGSLKGGWARFALDGNGIFWEVIDNASAVPLNIAVSTDGGVTFAKVDSLGSNDPTFWGTEWANDPIIMAHGNKIAVMNNVKKLGSLAKLGLGTRGTTNPDSASGTYLWSSTDGGNTWQGKWVLYEGDNVISNRPNYEPLFQSYDVGSHFVDPKGVVHLVQSGVNSIGRITTPVIDTINVYPLLYWNDRDKNWISLELPEVEQFNYTPTANSWGNIIGAGRPVVGTDSTGNVVVVMWNRAQFSGAPGTGTINTYTAGASPRWYYDIVYAYSTNKGVTWSAPIIADREPNKAYVYPSIGAIERRNDSAYVHYVYMYDEIPGSFVLSQNAKSVNNATRYNVQKFFVPPVGVNDNIVVNNFTLEQNYPNPFNPSTKISYSISERSNVSIKVFDMLGREVAELINSAREAGSYEITFDASNLSSGLYIYTINAGNFSASKKMMLMK